jgi:hypothetical protein
MTQHSSPQAGRTLLTLLFAILGFFSIGSLARGQDKQVTTVSPLYEEEQYLFKTNEFFIDIFGAIANAKSFEIGDVAGGGLGVGYFFTRYTAVYAEGYLLDSSDVDGAALGGVILRLPLDDFCTAFYAFAEYGGMFGDDATGSFQFGAGVDIRLTDHTSFFVDAREIDNQHTSLDSGNLYRIGLRFVF